MRMPPFNLHNPSTLEDALTKASELESSGEELLDIRGYRLDTQLQMAPQYKKECHIPFRDRGAP